MHFYRFFGLNFCSEFKFPFIDPVDELKADIYIRFGNTPKKLNNIKNQGVLYQTNDKEFLFWLNNIGRYYVKNGKEIIIDKDPLAGEKDIYTFFAGTILGALFQQRNTMAIHGCTVSKNKNAVIISGKTGSGKSSMAVYLNNLQYNIITDDISVIKFDSEENIWVEQGPAYIKLWHDILMQYDNNIQSYKKLRDNINKYIYPIKHIDAKHKLHTIYVLKTSNNDNFNINEIKGAEKFNYLRRNIYKPQFIRNTVFEKNAFMQVSLLAQKCKVIEIIQPVNKYFPERIMEEVSKQIG